MKKRVAFLINQYKTVQSGPGRFSEYLRQMEFPDLEITFFSHQAGEDMEQERRVSLPFWIRHVPLSWVFRSYFYARTLKRHHKEKPFDFILAIDYSLGLFVAFSPLKSSLYSMVNDDNYLRIFQKGEHQKGMSRNRRWARRLGYFLESAVSRRAGFIIANSLYTKGLVEEIYKIKHDKVFLLYKAVDLSFFSFKEREVRSPHRFLFVKNDWKRGGLDLILKAFSRLANQEKIHLSVVGISPGFQHFIKEMAEKEGFKGQLTVTGLLDRSNLKKEMDLADVFINMSRQEALGVACLEAMASGIPVVASNAGGLKEVLDFGTAGFMIQNESVEDLVSTLEEINANPGLLQTKIANGLLQVEKFSVDRLRENIIRLFS
jgi:glycosyltransferase involved in cell wall biosynthesis